MIDINVLLADPAKYRERVFHLLLDPSNEVRNRAALSLALQTDLTPEERRLIEASLDSGLTGYHEILFHLLASGGPEETQGSILRLASGTTLQQASAREFQDWLSDDEFVAEVAESLRLFRPIWFTPANRTPALRPEAPPLSMWEQFRSGARLILDGIDQLMLRIPMPEPADQREQLGGFQTESEPLGSMPGWIQMFHEAFEPWWDAIRQDLLFDGVEAAVLMGVCAPQNQWAWSLCVDVLGEELAGVVSDPANQNRVSLLGAVAVHTVSPAWADTLMDLAATALARLDLSRLDGPPEVVESLGGSREYSDLEQPILLDDRLNSVPILDFVLDSYIKPWELNDDQLSRYWHLLRFRDEPQGTFDPWNGEYAYAEFPVQGMPGSTHEVLTTMQLTRIHPGIHLAALAYLRGLATEADVLDALMFLSNESSQELQLFHSALNEVTRAVDLPLTDPGIQALADKVLAFIHFVQSHAVPTPPILIRLMDVVPLTMGSPSVVTALKALDGQDFVTDYRSSDESAARWSAIIRTSLPTEADTPESLMAELEPLGVTQNQMLSLAVFAPQWSVLIGKMLHCEGLQEIVWWLHAHAEPSAEPLPQDLVALRSEKLESRMTYFSVTRLSEGMVDIGWFRRAVRFLGREKVKRVVELAHFVSTGLEYRQAQDQAVALLGDSSARELRAEVMTTRSPNATRALGCLALPQDKRLHQSELLARYATFRFMENAELSSDGDLNLDQKLAAYSAVHSLAEIAGFRDHVAMRLELDALGLRGLDSDRVRPEDRSAALARSTETLESILSQGYYIDPDELARLMEVPLMAAMLRNLVLVDAAGHSGFPSEKGDALLDAHSRIINILGAVRLAHPAEPLMDSSWDDFRSRSTHELIHQAFPQFNRRVITPTSAERASGAVRISPFENVLLDPGVMAMRLFSARWMPAGGSMAKLDFTMDEMAAFSFVGEGWDIQGERVANSILWTSFVEYGSGEAIPVAAVPARVFSETLLSLEKVVGYSAS